MPSSLAGTTLVGFDSAWADTERAPGAICALAVDGSGRVRFHQPRLVGFGAAADFVQALHNEEQRTIVAIDQPTIVPNATGMRPCERVVATVASWSGGGIQPANREGKGKIAMFGDHAPIWAFLKRLEFRDDPVASLSATQGGYVMEVFPALAVLDLDPAFIAGPKAGPRYNPSRRKTFKQRAWRAVCDAVTKSAAELGLREVAGWCQSLDRETIPRKSVQDALDSVICLLVAALWLCDRDRCVMIGDLDHGYIVAPAGRDIRAKLAAAAEKQDVVVA